jgi:hypothetical protein
MLTIALIANNREASLRRLCDSLLVARYDGSFSTRPVSFNA